MTHATGKQRDGWRATHVLSAALGAALVLPSLAFANIVLPSAPAAVAGETGPTWPGPWSRTEVQRLIVTEAVSNGTVPAPLALAVADVASDFVPRSVGYSGTVGVMQLHPHVAKSEFGADADALRDPATNIRHGLRWLARLHERYDGDWELALSHYRGGELAKVDGRYRGHEFTHAYVRRVMNCWRRYQRDLLVRAWIREANGAPRFVSDGIQPRFEARTAGNHGAYHRQHVYERYPHDHDLGRFPLVDRRCDDTVPTHWPARFRFSDGDGWSAIEGAPRVRNHRGGRYTGDYGYGDVVALGQGARGEDPFGYRNGFIGLVRLAQSIAALDH